MSRVDVWSCVFPLPKGQAKAKRGEATAVPIRVYLSFAMSAVDPWGDFEVKSSFLRLYLV